MYNIHVYLCETLFCFFLSNTAISSKTVARVLPSELLREDSRSLPLLGRDFKAGQRLNLVSPPTRNSPTLAKVRMMCVNMQRTTECGQPACLCRNVD